MTTDQAHFDHRSSVRLVPVTQLRGLHRLMQMILLIQLLNMAFLAWRAFG